MDVSDFETAPRELAAGPLMGVGGGTGAVGGPSVRRGSRVTPPEPTVERLPIWLAGVILVAYCSVFWIGVITIVRWLLAAGA